MEGLESLGTGIAGSLNDLGAAIINGLIDGLKELFVPSYNPIDEVKSKIENKYTFLSQISEISNSLFAGFSESSAPPSFTVTYRGKTMTIVDFSAFVSYRSTVHGIIIAIAWTTFILWLIKFVPQLLKGVS